MNSDRIWYPDIGGPLAAEDYALLTSRWIPASLAEQARLRRVDSITGREVVGRRNGDCAGILIPYFWPSDERPVEYRLRRDNPDLQRNRNGDLRPSGKYLSPPGRRNHLYLMPGTLPEQVKDKSLKLIITEGEFKVMALYRLGHYKASQQLFLPAGLAGVWNWRGTIGKVTGPKGERRDEKGVITELDRIDWNGRQVIIAFDADINGNPSIKAARYCLSRELRERGAHVGFLEWDVQSGKGIDDWLAARGPEEVQKAIDSVDFNRTTGWRAELRVSGAGKPRPLLENARIALAGAPEWEGVLGFDEFRVEAVTLRPAPWSGSEPGPWTQNDDLETACWLQRNNIEVGAEIAGQAVQVIAKRTPIHPVRAYLDSLRWDGTRRIDNWLIEYCGGPCSNYVAAVGPCVLMSAVARIYEPGCKVDNVLILEGPQGARKSLALRTLGGDWFRDQLPDIRTKDAALQLKGVWVFELAELDTLSRAATSTIKAFISTPVDSYRPPYGRRCEDVPRQCIFVGTVNHETYFKDETGNRRFWPVRCGSKIDVEGLQEDRDQLWAEAVERYRDGEHWWLEDDLIIKEAEEQQAARFESHPWQILIAEQISTRENVSVEDLLQVVGVERGRWTPRDKITIGRILVSLGWTRYRARTGQHLVWRYRPRECQRVS